MSGYLGVFIDAPQGYEGDYDYFKNVTVSSADSKGNFTITEHGVNADMQEGTFTMPCYNKFGIDLPTDTTMHYSVEGVLHIYNDKAQFQPTKFTAYDWSTRLWKVWYQGQDKMSDLNCFTIESAMKLIAGTARSMGISVKGDFPEL